MVLAVDIGNTNIVMGCFESDRILFVERLSTNQQSTALEYAIMLKNILEIHSIDINDFKGGMAENYVNVQLSINGYHTYYWESERGAEIDFIIQRDGQLIPIEVKSADNTRAKSLKVYMDTYKPAYAIKLSAKNFGFEDNKKIVPLYAAFCI